MTAPIEPVADAARSARRLRVVVQNTNPLPAKPTRVLLSNPVLGTLIFLSGEVMLFAGLISAFAVLRANAEVWPPADQPRLPVVVTGINTLFLLASAVTMWLAVRSAQAQRGSEVKRWIIVTACLGGLFLLIQGTEWVQLMSYGLATAKGTYAGIFYTLIGCHGLHVVIGVTVLLTVLRRVMAGRYITGDPAGLNAAGLFWAFVVGIWPFLYVFVYLT
jgi:heme/copper-type cytochrome/quinol oxidase subunit 3